MGLGNFRNDRLNNAPTSSKSQKRSSWGRRIWFKKEQGKRDSGCHRKGCRIWHSSEL